MTIFFYKRLEKPYGVFSNFSHHPFELDGKTWATCEHYYQAMKFEDEEVIEQIRQTKSPMDAAKLGRIAASLKPNWDSIKIEIMRRALLAKFSQNSELLEILLSTGTEEIIEKTNVDHYWGCGERGDGLNMLGKLLMEVRAILHEA